MLDTCLATAHAQVATIRADPKATLRPDVLASAVGRRALSNLASVAPPSSPGASGWPSYGVLW